MAWLFSGRSIINRESDGCSKLAHNTVGLWRSRWYRGKKRYSCQLSLDFWMLLTLIQEWEMVMLVTRKATWVVRNKHACNTLQPTRSGAAPTSLTPYFWQRCYRHLLSSQYTRVSITAEDLLDLVEWEREGKLHQKLAPLDPGPGGFRHSTASSLRSGNIKPKLVFWRRA